MTNPCKHFQHLGPYEPCDKCEIERLQAEVRMYRMIAGCAMNGTDEADRLAKLPSLDAERETLRLVHARGLAALKAGADAARRSPRTGVNHERAT